MRFETAAKRSRDAKQTIDLGELQSTIHRRLQPSERRAKHAWAMPNASNFCKEMATGVYFCKGASPNTEEGGNSLVLCNDPTSHDIRKNFIAKQLRKHPKDSKKTYMFSEKSIRPFSGRHICFFSRAYDVVFSSTPHLVAFLLDLRKKGFCSA